MKTETYRSLPLRRETAKAQHSHFRSMTMES